MTADTVPLPPAYEAFAARYKADPADPACADQIATYTYGWDDSTARSAADNAALRAENEQLRRRIEVPTIDRGSQNWKALDGATAFHLIERHADDWADVAQMMDEWLEARTDTLSKRVEELEAASLFWDADDPERGCSSIEEVIAEYDPGVIVKINRAARLPDITILTLPVADDASYAEYEVIPSQPKDPK